MFEETLMIIKSDYLSKRKILLIKMLGYGFQIQGSRRCLFTPELAALFYKKNDEESNFMLQVILLSKGPCEAIILTMENAVAILNKAALCYFCTTKEMDRYVHVSKSLEDACREIKFIFPNYICDPIEYFDKSRFCHEMDMAATLGAAYDILKERQEEGAEDWKLKLGKWFLSRNKDMPVISNACSPKPGLGWHDRSVQTRTAAVGKREECSILTSGSSSVGSSGKLSSSSCISCHGFESSARTSDKELCNNLILKKTDVPVVQPTVLPIIKEEKEEECEEICELEYIVLKDEQASQLEEEEEGESEPSTEADHRVDIEESVEQVPQASKQGGEAKSEE